MAAPASSHDAFIYHNITAPSSTSSLSFTNSYAPSTITEEPGPNRQQCSCGANASCTTATNTQDRFLIHADSLESVTSCPFGGSSISVSDSLSLRSDSENCPCRRPLQEDPLLPCPSPYVDHTVTPSLLPVDVYSTSVPQQSHGFPSAEMGQSRKTCRTSENHAPGHSTRSSSRAATISAATGQRILRDAMGSVNGKSAMSYPRTVRLPDGEEMYYKPSQAAAFRNMQLRSSQEMDSIIRAPPNVTVDASVCENMYLEGGHRCRRSQSNASSSSIHTPPPPYRSHNASLSAPAAIFPSHHPDHHRDDRDKQQSGLGMDNRSSPPAYASVSRSGKLKEVFSSFLKPLFPSSRTTSRVEAPPDSDMQRLQSHNSPCWTSAASFTTANPTGPPPSYELAVREARRQQQRQDMARSVKR